jgi:hypothetical protein
VPRRVEGDEITENFSLSGPSRKFAQYLVCLTRSLFREGKRAFGVGVYDCVSSVAQVSSMSSVTLATGREQQHRLVLSATVREKRSSSQQGIPAAAIGH